MRHIGVAFAATLVAGWIVACVGEDPAPVGPQADPGVPVGQYKGACTADKKCIEGLVCVQEAVCLYPGDGAPPPDGSSSGAVTVPCPFASSSVKPTIQCDTTTCTNECCFGEVGPSACDEACATIDPRRSMKCDSKYQCSTGECCLAVTAALDTSKCPSPLPFVDAVESACVADGCDTSVGSNQYKMCRGDSECAAPMRCRQIEVTTGVNGTKLGYGVCN
ncbi:MAG: hypothetical protein KF764_06885 [Labilithrix sp.]|nr:hypothetical protein [Labilithrix sp.]MBX3219380.1 hypothetical protein [Labilithrix sp.]